MKKCIWMTCLLLVVLTVSVCLFPDDAQPSQLPRLYLEGDISGMRYKTDIRDISFTYVDGDQVTHGFATLQVQGTSSLKYDKRNFNIKLSKINKMDRKVGYTRPEKNCEPIQPN